MVDAAKSSLMLLSTLRVHVSHVEVPRPYSSVNLRALNSEALATDEVFVCQQNKQNKRRYVIGIVLPFNPRFLLFFS